MCTPKIKKVIQANRLLVFSLVEPTVFRSLTGPFFPPPCGDGVVGGIP